MANTEPVSLSNGSRRVRAPLRFSEALHSQIPIRKALDPRVRRRADMAANRSPIPPPHVDSAPRGEAVREEPGRDIEAEEGSES